MAKCVYCGKNSSGKRSCKRCSTLIDKERKDPKFNGYF